MIETFDTEETMVDRFYTTLHWALASNMPRKGGNLHPYSNGNMYRHLVSTKFEDGWKIEMSQDVEYSCYAMGYRADGSKRTPRTPLERRNFSVIDNCIDAVTRCFASNGGGVWLNDNRLY